MHPITSRIATALLALAASGCALVGGSPPERYGGGASLSEAAREAAADSADKHRELDVGHEAPSWRDWRAHDEAVVVAPIESEPTARRPGGKQDRWVLGAMAGGGSLGGREFEGFGFGGVDIGGFIEDRWRVDLNLMLLKPNLTAASVAGQGLDHEVELAADFSARWYLTPPHTFMGVYPMAGARFGTLFWDYRNPVQVIADGVPKTLTDDYLNYGGLYLGLGVSLVQARHFSTGLNLTAGFRSYEETTFEGFHNNLFHATGYTQLAYELTYKF